MPQISLSKKHLDELTAICNAGVDPLKLINGELEKSREVFLRLEDLSSFISKHLDEKTTASLVTELLSARRAADKYQMPVQEVLDLLEEQFVDKKWTNEELDRWRVVRPAFQTLAENEKIEIVVKASALYFGHVFHFHDFSIVTEMKPVFNESRQEIVGGIIENKLMLVYSDSDEKETSVEISITNRELKMLKELADRAIRQTDVLAAHLDKAGLPSRIFDVRH